MMHQQMPRLASDPAGMAHPALHPRGESAGSRWSDLAPRRGEQRAKPRGAMRVSCPVTMQSLVARRRGRPDTAFEGGGRGDPSSRPASRLSAPGFDQPRPVGWIKADSRTRKVGDYQYRLALAQVVSFGREWWLFPTITFLGLGFGNWRDFDGGIEKPASRLWHEKDCKCVALTLLDEIFSQAAG